MNEPLKTFASPYVVSSPLGAYVDGFWKTSGAPTTITILAVIQPTAGRDLQILPEGERTKETITIFTDTGLKLADQALARKGDQVAYRGRNFELKLQMDWDGTPLSHFKYLAQIVEDDS